jgi:hypothetical protein
VWVGRTITTTWTENMVKGILSWNCPKAGTSANPFSLEKITLITGL